MVKQWFILHSGLSCFSCLHLEPLHENVLRYGWTLSLYHQRQHQHCHRDHHHGKLRFSMVNINLWKTPHLGLPGSTQRRQAVQTRLQWEVEVRLFIAIILLLLLLLIIIIIIIITRPKPAYGRQGLAGSWGQDTDKVSNFWVFLTSHFAQLGIKPTWDIIIIMILSKPGASAAQRLYFHTENEPHFVSA